MKKNAMLKIAAVLLVAVLLTTCAISSTFAKYVTNAKDYDSEVARVAKWGITSDTTITGPLFAKSYQTGNYAVVNANTQLIAPGTSGQVTIVNDLGGTSEVSGSVKYVANCSADENLLSRINLQYSINDAAFKKVENISDLNTAINGLTTPIVPGQSLNDSDKTLVIKWDWKFEAEAGAKKDADENGIDDYDDFDNTLAESAESHTIQIKFDVTIEQTGPAGAAK